jgi:hypothetical protein
MTDTSRTLRIVYSPVKLLAMVGLGLLMTALAIIVIFLPDVPALKRFIGGYVGSVFFGLGTVLVAWRLLHARGSAVTISPEGIHDPRIAAALIPWNAVTRISTWSYRRQKFVVLAIEPSVEAQLGLTRVARWTRGVNRTFGADGLCITATGLKIDFETLLQTCLAYAQSIQLIAIR